MFRAVVSELPDSLVSAFSAVGDTFSLVVRSLAPELAVAGLCAIVMDSASDLVCVHNRIRP